MPKKEKTMLDDPVGRLHTVDHVMEVLAVRRTTVYKLARERRLEMVKVTNFRSRITDRSLKKFLDEIAENRAKTAEDGNG